MTNARRGLTHAGIIGALAIGLATLVTTTTAASTATVTAAFVKFFAAKSPDDAARAIPAVLSSGVSFQDAYTRLQRGRVYSANVPRGVVHLSRRVGRDTFYFDLEVPESYDPARTYQCASSCTAA